MHEYSEISQLHTQCTILESQINVLRTQNAELRRRIDQLEKPSTPLFKEIPNVGKFPLGPDDGDFQL
jgi:hypothetical protein